MQADIIKQISAAVADFSDCGDNSLECIGLTCVGKDISCKVYRMRHANVDISNMTIPAPVSGFIAAHRQQGFDFFDFSYRDKAYSAAFLVKNHSVDDSYHKQLEDRIVSVFKTKPHPLIQIGYLLDENGAEIGTKYYYTLNLHAERMNDRKRMNYVRDNNDAVKSFCSDFCGGDKAEFDRIFDICTQQNFRPFLIGLNEDGEKKLYYINELNKYDDISVIKSFMQVDDDLLELAAHCIKNNLYMRGMAFSVKNDALVYRLYFFRKDKAGSA